MTVVTVIALLAAHGLTIYAAWLIISGLRREKSELMDRWYVSKGLPVSGTKMIERQEKQEKKKEQTKGETLPRADPILKSRFNAIAKEPDGGYPDIAN